MMENNDVKKVVNGYFKFLVAIYALYSAFLVMLLWGDKIEAWTKEKFDKIKAKFGRKEATIPYFEKEE